MLKRFFKYVYIDVFKNWIRNEIVKMGNWLKLWMEWIFKC